MPSNRLFRHDQDLASAFDPASAVPDQAAADRGPDRAGQIESNAQLDGVIQRLTEGTDSAEGGEVQPALAEQIQSERSGGSALDSGVQAEVEQKLGTDLGEVRVHTDAKAAELATAVGAQAFTIGRDIFLGEGVSPTDTDLIAHEATHAVQQGMSTEPATEIGAADTAAEQSAEGVAAAPAIQVTREGDDTTSEPQIQRYVDDKQVEGQYARVSDGGNIIVLGKSNYSQDLYATSPMIDGANKKLEKSGKKGSYFGLIRSGGSIEWGGKTLERVEPVYKPHAGDSQNDLLDEENKGKDESDKMSLYADCGRSSRAVMGADNDSAPHANYNDGGKKVDSAAAYNPAEYSDEIYLGVMPDFLKNPAHADYLKAGVHYGTDKTDLINPGSAKQARTQYWELGDQGRRVFDQFAGINTAANPEIGGGYTLNTEYDMPGFAKAGKMTWNFHWAGMVMKDGSDNITLENYADGNGYDSINQEWNFQMYGTVKKGQTFVEQHMDSNTHGTRGSAFAVEPDGS